jgi:hypothetical protein
VIGDHHLDMANVFERLLGMVYHFLPAFVISLAVAVVFVRWVSRRRG